MIAPSQGPSWIKKKPPLVGIAGEPYFSPLSPVISIGKSTRGAQGRFLQSPYSFDHHITSDGIGSLVGQWAIHYVYSPSILPEASVELKYYCIALHVFYFAQGMCDIHSIQPRYSIVTHLTFKDGARGYTVCARL